MRSGSTSRLRATDLRQIVSSLAVIALLAVTLAACASGNAESADEAATRRAAESTNVVGDVEATQIIKNFFEPTPKPSPYPTQLPVLANLLITTNPSDNGAGPAIYSYNRSSGTLSAQAQISHLQEGEVVVAVWTKGGDTVGVSEVAIGNDHDLAWVTLQWNDSTSASSGSYAVHIQVRGPGTNDDGTPADVTTELGSLVFSIN